ncbi:MAG: hypothetical protein E6G74_02440 [Alphaproteobacteria bacterium]|nr:MAG: hypothetical protein E6G77_23095 [Alphaproteobacteria bacterium]TMK04951.1 MAG: hypothetical protein E6G74_02440 [Alphaproteobacteria bacterium]
MTYVVSRMFDQIKDALSPLRRISLRWFEGSFLKMMLDNYHPEQHYMRGSGPKSRSMDCKQDPPSKRA